MSFVQREIERVTHDRDVWARKIDKQKAPRPEHVEYLARLNQWIAELENTKREGEQA